MKKSQETPSSLGGDLFPLMMANALLWAVAIVTSLIVLQNTGYFVRLFPLLAGGACVASVGCSITWKRRKAEHRMEGQSLNDPLLTRPR